MSFRRQPNICHLRMCLIYFIKFYLIVMICFATWCRNSYFCWETYFHLCEHGYHYCLIPGVTWDFVTMKPEAFHSATDSSFHVLKLLRIFLFILTNDEIDAYFESSMQSAQNNIWRDDLSDDNRAAAVVGFIAYISLFVRH